MRVECESCHELVVASFAIDADAVRATCPVCAHVTVVHTAPAAARAAPLCPKCGAAIRGTSACAICGLAVERMAAYRDVRDAAVPEPLREAWDRAAGAWSDPARHDEVLRLVAVHNSYAWAAGRYRARGRDPIAARQLDRLRRAAEATLLASATVRPDKVRPYRATVGVLAILVAAIVVGLIYAMVARTPVVGPSAPGMPARPLTPGHPVTSSSPGGS